jgi:hypothetical protein
VRVGGFGPKSENRAAGARFSRTNCGGPLKWVEGTYLGLGKPGLRGWEVGIDRCARVVWCVPKTENRATGARFSRTNHGGLLKWVEGTYLGPGKPGLRSWELGIDGRTRVEGFGGETKSRAAVARFSRTKCEGPRIWAVGT